jgi:small subunit ribosomal protein S16
MLAIRMQRTGRKGHAMFRVVVQDSRRTPTSGRIVAQLGSYDPHAKSITIDKEKAGFYLDHGAQPSDRVVRLLKSEGVTIPDWVKLPSDRQRVVRHAEKRRSTAPAPEEVEAPAETPVEAEVSSTPDVEASDSAATETVETPEASEPAEAPTETAEDTTEEVAAAEAPAATEVEEPAETPSEEE